MRAVIAKLINLESEINFSESLQIYQFLFLSYLLQSEELLTTS